MRINQREIYPHYPFCLKLERDQRESEREERDPKEAMGLNRSFNRTLQIEFLYTRTTVWM